MSKLGRQIPPAAITAAKAEDPVSTNGPMKSAGTRPLRGTASLKDVREDKGHRLMAGALRSLGEDLEIGGGSAATFGHELIELGLVLGHAKTCQEVLKLPLLFLEPVQGLGAIVVERLVAARACRVPPGPPTSHLVHACLPAAKSVVE